MIQTLPSVFLVPFRAYSRHLSGQQATVALLVAERTLGAGEPWLRLGLSDFGRLFSSSRGAMQPVVRALVHDHKLLEQREGSHSAPRRFRVTGWQQWTGWEPGQKVEVVRSLHLVVLGEDFPINAVRMAEALRLHAQNHRSEAGPVPPVDPADPIWQRWCKTMAELLRQGHGPKQHRQLLDWLSQASVEGPRIAGPAADRLFLQRLPTLKRNKRLSYNLGTTG